MKLWKWIFFLCAVVGLSTGAFWVWHRTPPAPARRTPVPYVAPGHPGWDFSGVQSNAAKLLKKADYAGLDRLANEIKAKGYDIRQNHAELHDFYAAFELNDSPDERHWLDRQTELEGWLRARPDSLTAKIAMARWYIKYAWEARGTGRARTVSREGWRMMHDRLVKAKEYLDSVPENQIDDPMYYYYSITIAVDADSPRDVGERAFSKGVKLAPNFFPLYSTRAYFLLPRWYGKKGDSEQFAREVSADFPPDVREIFISLVALNLFYVCGDDFFKETAVDYDLVKRGLLTAEKFDHRKGYLLSKLCCLAAFKGDRETAAKLFLDLGLDAWPKAFDTFDRAGNMERLRKDSGAQDRIDGAMTLEQKGQLDEVEPMWRSFHPDAKTSPWLRSFYMRQGNEAALRELTRKLDGKTCAELLDSEVAQDDPDALADLSRLGPLVGMWEKSEAAAQAFDQKRPWNVTGKNILWLCALHQKDGAKAEALRGQFAALKTDRPAYQAAQAVLKGEKTWQQVSGDLKNQDPYVPQAVTAIALYYLTQGKPQEAREVLRQALPLCRENDEKVVLESLLFGSIARSLDLARADAPQVP